APKYSVCTSFSNTRNETSAATSRRTPLKGSSTDRTPASERVESASASISVAATPSSSATKVAAPPSSYAASTSACRRSIWVTKNATAMIANASASTASDDRSHVCRRSTTASQSSCKLLPQLALDIFAKLVEHAGDGRFHLRCRRAALELPVQ